jgi:hypothetical protein
MDRKDTDLVKAFLNTPQSPGKPPPGMYPYEPTTRDLARNKAMDLASYFGASKYGAQDFGQLVAGSEMDPNQGLFGMGLADFAPGLGTYMGAEEGMSAAERGDWIGAGAGALGTAASIIPVVGPLVSKGGRKAIARFALDEFGGVPLPGKRKPVTSLDLRPNEGLFYSPSLLAASNLPQSKGTADQMRAMLTKGGAKEEELQWSGFDDWLKEQNGTVTQDEIIRYLEGETHTPYTQKIQEATGTSGAETISDEDLYDRYVEDNLQNEVDYYRTDYYPQRLAEEHQQVSDLDADALQEAAESMDMGDDIEGFLQRYGDHWLEDTSDPTTFYREDEAVDRFFGDPEYDARESLRESARYGLDLDELRRDYGGGDDGFDPGDTEFGAYFPTGGTNYRENIAVLDEDRIRAVSRLPKDRPFNTPSHFSGAGELTPFWTRSADFPSNDGTTRYVGEVQSDWGQRGQGASNPNRTKTLAEERAFAGLIEDVAAKKAREEVAYDAMPSPYSETANYIASRADNTGSRADRVKMGVVLPEDAEYAAQTTNPDRFTNRFLQERLAMVPEGFLEDQGLDYALQGPLRPTWRHESQSWSPRRVEGVRERNTSTLPTLSETWLRQNQPLPEGSLPGFVQDPRYEEAGRWVDEMGTAREEWQDAYDKLDTESQRYSAGPYVRKTENWATQALRNELADAILDGKSSLTINPGDDDLVRAVSGGNTNPKPFYEGTMPGIFEKMVKGYGGKVEQIPARINDTQRFVPGVRLTPEFIAEVKRKGIPFFAVPGGAMIGAAAGTGQEEGF